MKSKNIAWGFHDEKDLNEVLKLFGSTTVQSIGIQPPKIYDIIGRVGYKGAWVYREKNNKQQWYLTHTLDNQFQKVENQKQKKSEPPTVDYSDPSKFSPEIREVLGI